MQAVGQVRKQRQAHERDDGNACIDVVLNKQVIRLEKKIGRQQRTVEPGHARAPQDRTDRDMQGHRRNDHQEIATQLRPSGRDQPTVDDDEQPHPITGATRQEKPEARLARAP